MLELSPSGHSIMEEKRDDNALQIRASEWPFLFTINNLLPVKFDDPRDVLLTTLYTVFRLWRIFEIAMSTLTRFSKRNLDEYYLSRRN